MEEASRLQHRRGHRLQLKLVARTDLGEERRLVVLIDTGAEVNLVKPGVFEDHAFVKAKKELSLVTASGDALPGGAREVRLQLRLRVHDQPGVQVHTTGTFYEAAIVWDAIVGYDFLITHGLAIWPAGRCLMDRPDEGWRYLGGEEPLDPPHKKPTEKEIAATRRRRWITTDYAVCSDVVRRIVKELDGGEPTIDAFATKENKRFPRCWTEEEDAFKQNWGKEELLWMNPPFDKFPQVLAKIKEEGARAILVVPSWEYRGWLGDLDDITVRTYHLQENSPLFNKFGKESMDTPRWVVHVYYVDGGQRRGRFARKWTKRTW